MLKLLLSAIDYVIIVGTAMKLSTSGKQYDIRFQRSQFNANKLYF